MSRGANLSIMGLYDYDNTVLDLLQLPEDFTETQIQTVKDNILYECAELEFLYPNPTVAKNVIGIWSAKELPYWERIYAAAQLEYDPIENYRRNETDTITDNRTETHSGSDISTAGGTDTASGSSTTTDTESGTDTTTNKITGYDSNDLVNHDSSDTQYGHGNSEQYYGSNSQTYGRTDTLQHGESISHGGTTTHSILAYGNIGTMTSQDMLTQEMEVAKIIQVIPIIIESFKNRFCLLVY